MLRLALVIDSKQVAAYRRVLPRLTDARLVAVAAPEADGTDWISAARATVTTPTPDAFLAKIRREVELVGRIVKRAGIEPIECEFVWAWVPKEKPQA